MVQVKLLGFCVNTKDRLLVYEYMSNGSLFDHLHGTPLVDLCPILAYVLAYGTLPMLQYMSNGSLFHPLHGKPFVDFVP